MAALDDGHVVPGRDARGDKLPIYPQEVDTVTLVVSPNPLVEHITTAREAASGVVGQARSVVESGVSRWIGLERSVEREVKQIIAPDEPLTPGIIYVLVAGLTGSVLTRTRSFPVRFLAPPVFTLAALPYFLPKTAHNLRAYLSDVEDKVAPEFAASHDRLNDSLALHWHLATDRLRGASREAQTWSEKAVRGVENTTGLRVSDAVRIGQERAERGLEHAKAKMAQATANAREHAPDVLTSAPSTPEPVAYEKVGVVVEQIPIAEIVVPVESEVPAAPAPVAAAPAVPVAPAPVAAPAPAVPAAPLAVEVVTAEPTIAVAPVAAPAAPAAAAAAPAPAKEDKKEKPRELVPKSIPEADAGKRLV